jgi:hypothetical protein
MVAICRTAPATAQLPHHVYKLLSATAHYGLQALCSNGLLVFEDVLTTWNDARPWRECRFSFKPVPVLSLSHRLSGHTLAMRHFRCRLCTFRSAFRISSASHPT